MILGRPTDQVAAAVTALLNLAFIAGTEFGGITFSVTIVAAANVAALAVVAVIAGQTPTVNKGDTVNVVTPGNAPNTTITA